MKVLTVTNMWPTSKYPFFGVFVKEQVDGLLNYNSDIINKIWFINGRRSVFNYLLSIFSLNWHLLFNKYDIIHVHFGLSGLFLLFRINKRIPVVVTLHGSDINIESSTRLKVSITQKIIRKADLVLCVSDKMKAKTNMAKKVEVLPCAVNTDLFVPGEKGEKTKIVFASSKSRPEKNYTLFSSIVNLYSLTRNVKIEEVVIDNMSREEVLSAIQQSALLLLTSVSEGSPQIVKEAMACNTPVISTNVGDVENLLSNVKNSYVVRSNDPKDFLSVIDSILFLERGYRYSDGRKKVEMLGLDAGTISRKLFQYYKQVINEK